MAIDGVQHASFRGVPFTATDVENGGHARRVEVHEYPFRDVPFAEDFGHQARTFTIQCFVSWEQRRALEDVCGEPGAGTLVHPFYGTLQVVCTGCTSRDSTRNLRITLFSLTFAEVGANQYPAAVADSRSGVETSAETGHRDLQQSFLKRFLGPVPQWVTNASIARVGDIAGAIDAAARLMPGGVNLAAFTALRAELSDAAALVANPAGLADVLSRTVQGLAGLSSDPLTGLRVLEEFAGSVGASFGVILGTGSLGAEAERQDALVRLTRSAAVIEGARTAAVIPLDSYSAASALRERMVALFEGEVTAAGDRGDDEALEALVAVRTRSLEDLRERGGKLAAVRTVTLAASVPAVVLAFRLYADPERAEEIVARNRIRHPGFVPAAVPLEVLSA